MRIKKCPLILFVGCRRCTNRFLFGVKKQKGSGCREGERLDEQAPKHGQQPTFPAAVRSMSCGSDDGKAHLMGLALKKKKKRGGVSIKL